MNIEFFLIIFGSFIGGLFIGLVAFLFHKQKIAVIINNLNSEISNLNEKKLISDQRVDELLAKINFYESEKRDLEVNLTNQREALVREVVISDSLRGSVQDLKSQLLKIEIEKSKLEEINSNISCKLAGLESQKETLEQNLKLINDSLLHQFKNIATNVMNENSEKFSDESRKKIDNLINPLSEKLQNLQKNMQECFDIEAKEKFSLKESISKMLHSNDQIKYEAAKLSHALKGNKAALGHWGEIVLENLLVSSGLRKDQDYFLQSSFQNERENRLKPDVLIKLPDEKYIIIDAKTSFFDFNAYDGIAEKERRDAAAKDFVQRIKSHIDSLSAKEYHSSLGLATPELTLMFIPIESWYNLAIQSSPELYQYAWNKNIAIISPSTLFVILKTISYIWKGKIQAQNSLKVADQAGKLYDQFVEFIANLSEIGKSLERAHVSYEKAMSRLSTGRGNLVKRAEAMRALGVNSTKKIDENLVAIAENSEENSMIVERSDENVILES